MRHGRAYRDYTTNRHYVQTPDFVCKRYFMCKAPATPDDMLGVLATPLSTLCQSLGSSGKDMKMSLVQ